MTNYVTFDDKKFKFKLHLVVKIYSFIESFVKKKNSQITRTLCNVVLL